MMRFQNMVLFVLSSITLGGLQHVSADDRAELASYFDAHGANWSAIRKMDVFCKTEEFREPGVEPGFTETTWERLAFDSDSDRYAYVKVFERRLIQTEEVVESVETGFIIKDGMYRSFAGNKRRYPPQVVESREKVFDEHRMPDWRILMLMGNGRGSPQTWTENRANAMHVLPQRAATVKKISSDRSGVVFESFDESGSGHRYTFRDEDLMPSKVHWLFKYEPGAVKTVGVERFSWKEVANVLVPDAVEGTYQTRQFRLKLAELQKLDATKMTAEEAKEFYVDVTVHRDMQFEWLGVNSSLADELFDFGLIDSPSAFLDLCETDTVDKFKVRE
jgi:hypothetical protein